MAIQGPKQKRYIVLDTNKQEYIMVGTYDEIQAEFNQWPDIFIDDKIMLDIYELGELQEITLVRPSISFISVTEALQKTYNEMHKIN